VLLLSVEGPVFSQEELSKLNMVAKHLKNKKKIRKRETKKEES